MLYTHEEFMEARGKKLLEAKGYKVENNLIVYPGKEKKEKPKPAAKKLQIAPLHGEKKEPKPKPKPAALPGGKSEMDKLKKTFNIKLAELKKLIGVE